MAGYGAPAGGYGGQATKGNGIPRSPDIWVSIAEKLCVCKKNFLHNLCFRLLQGNAGVAKNGAAVKGNGKSLYSFDFFFL